MEAGTAGLPMEDQGEDHRAAMTAAKTEEGAMTEARVEMQEPVHRNRIGPTVQTGARRRQAKGMQVAPHQTAESRNRNSRCPMEVLWKDSG